MRRLLLALLCPIVLAGLLAGCGTKQDTRPAASPTGSCTSAKDHPLLTRGSDIAWTKEIGRFQLALRNGGCAAWRGTQLRFTLIDIGYEPETTRLEYRASANGAWRRLPMQWYDPEEPERLQSAALPIDFQAGESKTYDFRITLPEPPDIRAFGLGATLNPARGTASPWSSSLSVRSRTGQSVRVLAAPASITPLGGWREFEVEVGTTRRLDRDVRLDLSSAAVGGRLVHDTVEFQQFRSGAWQALDRVSPATADFPLPKGTRERLRFRVRVGAISGRENGTFGLSGQLRLSGESPDVPPLASAGRPVELVLPRLDVVPPERRPKAAGESAEYQLTIGNQTGVAYPALRVQFNILPSPLVGRIDYRCGSAGWTRLPTTSRQTNVEFALPGSSVPDGYRADCRIRVTPAEPLDQGLNWYVTLADPAHGTSVQNVDGHL